MINSHDYGVAQNRVRVYIIGFRNLEYYEKFNLPKPITQRKTLAHILGIKLNKPEINQQPQKDLFGNQVQTKQMSLSSKNGFNDYFLFNDLRNGNSTIHSWDITNTTKRQKDICLLLLKNRRKSQFGPLDGNPLSLKQFQSIDPSINQKELNDLVKLTILKKVKYCFEIIDLKKEDLKDSESELLNCATNGQLILNDLKSLKSLKIKRISISDTINTLLEKEVLKCTEIRFDFKNTKISSGLNGVNRVFMPSSDVFPTLVASDTNDYVSLKSLDLTDHEDVKKQFLQKVYFTGNYRKITKEEACMIQGFPKDFKLPESRSRWMKLIGNSVSVPVIKSLINSILATGVFDKENISDVPVSNKQRVSI